IARDGEEIALHRCAPNRLRRSPGAHEGLGGEVFRLMAIATEMQREAEDVGRVLPVERAEIVHWISPWAALTPGRDPTRCRSRRARSCRAVDSGARGRPRRTAVRSRRCARRPPLLHRDAARRTAEPGATGPANGCRCAW